MQNLKQAFASEWYFEIKYIQEKLTKTDPYQK